jgi:hypothetical protein
MEEWDNSDSDSDNYEYGTDEYEEECLLDEMYDFEENFDLKEKENGKYYLGMYMNIPDVQLMAGGGFILGNNKPLFFGNAISTELFFKYKYTHIQTYLKTIIMCRRQYPVVDIMQLIISEDGLYLALIKTYWICLIQRHWKKIMNKKREYIEFQKSFQYIQDRELGKKNKPTFSLYGMLSIYRSSKSNRIV